MFSIIKFTKTLCSDGSTFFNDEKNQFYFILLILFKNSYKKKEGNHNFNKICTKAKNLKHTLFLKLYLLKFYDPKLNFTLNIFTGQYSSKHKKSITLIDNLSMQVREDSFNFNIVPIHVWRIFMFF